MQIFRLSLLYLLKYGYSLMVLTVFFFYYRDVVNFFNIQKGFSLEVRDYRCDLLRMVPVMLLHYGQNRFEKSFLSFSFLSKGLNKIYSGHNGSSVLRCPVIGSTCIWVFNRLTQIAHFTYFVLLTHLNMVFKFL